jgi:WD40 repeat protein
VVYSPCGTKIASGSLDKTLRIWNVKTGKCDSTLRGHSKYVTAVFYSCLFSNVWCVLTIEHFTAGLRVFPSVRMVNMLLAAATTKA